MNYRKWISNYKLQKLCKVNSLRATGRFFGELLFILSMIYFCEQHWSFLLFLFTLFFIGTRMHVLALLLHEAAHFNLNNNRKINDYLGELIGSLFFFSFLKYRQVHLIHHRNEHLNSKNDPDFMRKQNKTWVFPQKPSKLLKVLTGDLIGFGLFDFAKELQSNQSSGQEVYNKAGAIKWVRFLVPLVIVIFCSIFSLWRYYLLYWLLPTLTSFKFFLRFRAINDHYGLSKGVGLTQLRITEFNLFERFIFAPCNSGLHGIHHLFPSIPYFNLRETHKTLKDNPEYLTGIHQTKGTTGLLKELTRPYEKT